MANEIIYSGNNYKLVLRPRHEWLTGSHIHDARGHHMDHLMLLKRDVDVP